jgi:hypothetical protein
MAFTWAIALWSETRKAMGRCDVPCSTPIPEISCPRFASGDVREAVIKDLDISANTPSMAHELSSWISTSNSPTVPPATMGEAATWARPERFFSKKTQRTQFLNQRVNLSHSIPCHIGKYSKKQKIKK